MTYFNRFFLDREKDMIVNLSMESDGLHYELETPNHHSGNLIRNFARVCGLPVSLNENNLQVIRGIVPCYINAQNEEMYIFRLGNTKIANIYPDGRIEMKASVPSIAKTLMSQTKDYTLDESKTIFKTYILKDLKFRSDLHTHMNGNLSPDILMALGIVHQIRYPLYYVKKLGLVLSPRQEKKINEQRTRVSRQFTDSDLTGHYLERRIDDNTFINFADLILNNLENAAENIVRIRVSLAIMKDGQAVFTNLEKVYLYRYVFTKGIESKKKIALGHIADIPDQDVRQLAEQMLEDRKSPNYGHDTVFQDTLLWIARSYRRQGISYVEISDTTLVKKYESLQMLTEVHEVMPLIYQETGVMIRFLAALRRTPLTIVKSQTTPEDYLTGNLNVLNAIASDPYVAGCDFVGEEINDIIELKPVFKEIDRIAAEHPDFVIQIHAGENDSLKDNMAHSIACVKESLSPGQKMPKIRLGHGLYSYSLRSSKGQKLLKDLKENNIVLEFQISSNVRLNNLNSLDAHPIRQYLKAGICCVQGTDGGALYGTDSIDEQLSLEKLLNLSYEDLLKMRKAEAEIISEGMKSFEVNQEKFKELLGHRDLRKVLLSQMEERPIQRQIHFQEKNRLDANVEMKNRIEELPWDVRPVIIAGGSFNTDKRLTRMSEKCKQDIDDLLSVLDPKDVFFVVGHKISGYEKYLIDHNSKGFKIFAFIPARITPAEKQRLLAADVSIRVSPESEGVAIYKSFNYEIFERRSSIVICFDGNSAGENLIQEAKNGKGKASIFVNDASAALRKKGKSLEGYIQFFGTGKKIGKLILAELKK